MADLFDPRRYACGDLPALLWRVQLPRNQTEIHWNTGDVLAADDTRSFADIADFGRSVAEHVSWGNRNPTCFVSTFSSHEHAINWTRRWYDRNVGTGSYEVDILEIDIRNLLEDAAVFDASRLTLELGIDHPDAENEFIFLHFIPGSAIIDRYLSLGDLRDRYPPGGNAVHLGPDGYGQPNDRNAATEDGALYYDQPFVHNGSEGEEDDGDAAFYDDGDAAFYDDGTPANNRSDGEDDEAYSGPWYGEDSEDSEDEEERNRSDDILKMMEGDWNWNS